jgi:IPT/TIG domain
MNRSRTFSSTTYALALRLTLSLLLLLFISNSLAAATGISLVQHIGKDAGTNTTASVNFPSANTAGNFIAVAIRGGLSSSQVFTVTDSNGNSYKKAAQIGYTASVVTSAIYYAENIKGGANTVNVSMSVSGPLRFAILEYSGVATSGSSDGTAVATGSSSAPNSGNFTTTVSGDLLLGTIGTTNPATFTAGPGYTIRDFVPAEPNTKVISEDQIQSAAGSGAAGATLASSDSWGVVLAAFKPVGGGGTGPSVTGLSPTSGPVGTSVTITGTNFGASQGTSTVTFNGTAATPMSWSATSIVVPVPAGATAGNVVVTVGGVASNGVVFTVIPPPSITSLNPTSGPVGASVTITGANFGFTIGTSTVTFNGTAATPTSWSTTSIVVTVPNAATNGNVVVTVGGVASNGAAFTVLPTPSITSLSPTSGPWGTSVTITGSNFAATQGSSTVTFAGNASAAVTSWSATSIVATVPSTSGAGGGAFTGPVVVTVNGVVSNGVTFTVTPSISSLSPTSGPTGTSVTILGGGFGSPQGTSTVTFNGIAAVPTQWSQSGIIVPVPSAASSGNVVVTVGGVASNGAPFTVTPTISSLNPTSGPVGTSVTITGTNFGGTQGTSTVTFSGTTASPTSWSATSITVPAPNSLTTNTYGVVATVGGFASNTVSFTVAPAITSLNPTSGPISTPVTITGTSFGSAQGVSTVTFNGVAGTPTSWSNTSLVVPVPNGATTGNVVVTVGTASPSNGVLFNVTNPGPSITSLNPTSAPVGASVTITGANYGATQGTSTVTFNGTPASPASWSATSIVVPVPIGAATGSVVVTVGSVASNSVFFTVSPHITSLNPSSGTVGTSVTINGTNFGATKGFSSVSFNGTPTSPTSWSDTSVVAPVPSGAITGGNVVVTVGGVASSGVGFTVTPSPVISNVSPGSGPLGTSVTINGANFGATQGTSAVTFNGTAGTPTSWSATTIVVPVPTGATTGPLLVNVGAAFASGGTFTVPPALSPSITSLSPTSGTLGALVTITGTNFGATQGTSYVTFNGVVATPTSWTATTVVAPVPSGATTGNVVVIVGGIISNGVPFAVFPSIISLSPTSGQAGQSVAVNGGGFGATQGTSTVSFNGVLTTPTSWSPNGIIAPVPLGATSGNVVVKVAGQTSNAVAFAVTVATAGIKLVQHTSLDLRATTTGSLAFKSNNTAGNWIAVCVRGGNSSSQVFTITDSLGNTYRQATQLSFTASAVTLAIYYVQNIKGGGNTVTVSQTVSGPLRFALLEYSGVATSNSLDVTAMGLGTGSSPNSGTVATTSNGDLLLGAVATANPASFTAGSGDTIEEFVGVEPGTKLIAEDQIQASAGSASATASLAGSDAWGSVLAAFKPVGAAGTGPNITNLRPASGPVGTFVTLTGTNFGASQGSSTVTFNGTAANPMSWSATSIVVPVPNGATTGNVIVTVGSVASNGVSFSVTPPPPTITNLSPSSAVAGGGSLTLTVTGTNFVSSATVQWNGNARTTTFVSSTQLQATITAADIASAGVARIAVSNAGVGGGVSSTSTFLVGTTGGSNFATIVVNQAAKDIVYDPKNQVFYVSVPGTASTNPNTIAILDPAMAAITFTQPAGNNPNVLAISDDSQFLYAGIDGASSVQRFILPGLAQDIRYPLGADSIGPYFALDLQVAPAAPHTTAVTLGNSGVSPAAQGGIVIFDDATARPTIAPGVSLFYGSIQWGADATALFAANTETTGFDFYELSVASSGVSLASDFPNTFTSFGNSIHFDSGTKRIYSEEGQVINPSTGLPVGNFNARGAMAVDSSLNTAFFLSAGSGATAKIDSFDLAHFTPIGTITIPNVASTPLRLIRWGQNGLAFVSAGSNGTGQIILIGGNFVSQAPPFVLTPPPAPLPSPVPAPNAPTITSLNPSSAIAGSAGSVLNVTGTQFDIAATVQFNGSALPTTFVSSTQLQAAIPASDVATPGTANIMVANPPATGGNSSGATFFVGSAGGISSAGGFAVQIVNQASKEIVFDPADQLFYLSVPNSGPAGNTIAVLDPATAKIAGQQYAGSNPKAIAISDDGQFIYVGLDGSSSVQRFILPGLVPDINYSLGAASVGGGPFHALDLQVAPGLPHTTAVTLAVSASSPSAQGGITIFDDTAARPTIAKGFGPGGGSALYDSLQWGVDATALFAANYEDSGFDFYSLSVTSSGVSLVSDFQNTFSSFSNKIHFDPGTKLVYGDDGHVVNPATGVSLGTFPVSGFVVPIMVPDSGLNLAFFAAQTGYSSVTIYSYNLSTFAQVSSITISNVNGNPIRLIRWGQNGLAFNTDAGQIVLVGGNFVH